jgi:hypothetical protein
MEGSAVRNATVAFLVVLSLSSCVWTGSYGPYSYWGRNDSGYSDWQLAANKWQVVYRGNPLTDPHKVVDFTLLRAAELTASNGFRHFVIKGLSDGTRSSTHVIPGYGEASTTVAATCVGGPAVTCTGVGTSSYSYVPPTVYEVVRPGLEIQIEAFLEAPANADSFDAQLLRKNLKAKYELE